MKCEYVFLFMRVFCDERLQLFEIGLFKLRKFVVKTDFIV